MGLDLVELGIMVEEQFGVVIEIDDYERLKTVGDLERYVSWKLGRTGTGGWADYNIALVRGFCEIRREIMRQTGIPRSQLRPSTRLEQHWHSREGWNSASRSLEAALAVPLPTWRWEGWIWTEGWMMRGCLAALASLVLTIGVLAIGLDHLLIGVQAFVLICWGVGTTLSAKHSEDGFRSATLGSVARQACYPLSRLRGDDLPAKANNRSPGGDVMSRLVEMISEGFSVPREEIRPESRFYEDLKMG